jgi:hypothetical protein
MHMRHAIAVVSCLAATSAHANDLTCKQWFDLGQRSHLSHGQSGPMAAIGGQIKGTADTLNAMRMLTARQAQQAAPRHIDLVELWNAVVTACKHEEDKPVTDVLAAVQNAVVELKLALDRTTVK